MTTDDIENYFGSVDKAAVFFGVTSEAIYQWRNRKGKLIPKGRATEASLRTNGALKYDASLYQKPNETAA